MPPPILPYIGNNTDSHGDLKCPYCPLSGDVDSDFVGFSCMNGTDQQNRCGYVSTGDAMEVHRPRNDAAIRTYLDATWLCSDAYVDGDYEARNVGPEYGDPEYTGDP
jgi:hypothetical protein